MSRMFLSTVLLVLSIFSSNAEKYEALEFVREEKLSDVGREVSLGINRLTFKLLRYLLPANENTFFSPASVASSLAMLYFMTAGETAKEISSSLYLRPDSSLGEGFHDLLSHLRQENANITLANKVFVSNDFPLKSVYLKNIENYLKAQADNVVYKNPKEVRGVINRWTEKNTGGKILELLPPDSLSTDTVLVLVSTVYFKGAWHYTFPAKSTKKRVFTLFDGNTKKIPMMTVQKRLGYNVIESLKIRVLHIPYKDGRQNFVIVLPDEHDGLPQLEQNLIKKKHLDDVLDISSYTKVKATIPKMKLRKSMELKSVLEKVGIKKVFNRRLADFSHGVDHKGLSVSLVQHSSCIDVDEQGTEASAATGMGISMRAAFSLFLDVPEFTANHSFLFFVTDSTTKAILFAGRFTSPS